MTVGTIETVGAGDWIHAQLLADAQLNAAVGGRIYIEERDQGSALPAVIIDALSPGVDLMGLGVRRVWTDAVFIVKVVHETRSYKHIAPIAGRIDAVLHGASGGPVAVIYRIAPVMYGETDGDKSYRHLGGRFRALAR